MRDTDGPDGDMDPEISVVIPVYEQEELLAEALASVFDQTFTSFEVIVVDDGSTADYTSVRERYSDAPLKFFKHEQNRGASAARNTALSKARGTYIAFLDADDRWDPSKLEKQYRVFKKGETELGLVYTGFEHYELDGNRYEHHPSAGGDIYLEELERDRIHPTSTVMVKSECIERVGGFNTDLPSRQDYDLWMRITEQFTVSYVDELLVEKREQSTSISKDFDRRIAGDLAVFDQIQDRVGEMDLGPVTRNKIFSAHHLVIGRDYESNGDRRKAIRHLSEAVLRYPLRVNAWAMLVIAIFGIDRNGKLMTMIKKVLWA